MLRMGAGAARLGARIVTVVCSVRISVSFSNPIVRAPSAWVSTPCANDGFGYSPDARALYKIHAAKVHKYVGFYLIRLVRPDSMDTLF